MQDEEKKTPPETDAPEQETAGHAGHDGVDTPEGAPAAPEKPKPSLEEVLELAQGQIAELKEKVLRAMAETENVRRRSEREKGETAQYAITGFARDLVPVADNLGRTLDNLPDEVRNDPKMAAFIEGVELTGRELANVFEKHGIKEVRPHGEKFDHNLHQAMFEVEDPEKPAGTVMEVMQIGYTIGERLLRPAMVGVTKAPKPPAEEPKPDAANEAADQSEAEAAEQGSSN